MCCAIRSGLSLAQKNRIEAKSRIRIRIKVMRIRNNAIAHC
jgi:hypothetical protein